MKYLYLLLVLLVRNVTEGDAQIFVKDTVGVRIDSTAIIGECIDFPCWIQSVSADSTGTFLLVQGRDLNKKETSVKNTGDIWMISLSEKKVLWQRSINYFAQEAKLTDQGVSLTSKDKYFLLDLRTGTEIWAGKKMVPYSVNAADDRLLAYKGSVMNGITKQLQGYDLLTGNMLWKREISHRYGWNESLMLDDSTRLIVSDGLHTVNMSDGSGQSFPMKTGVDDYRSAAAIGALGLVAGALTGVGFFPYGNNVVVDLVSNVLPDDSLLYVANREQLLCLDRQLDMKWGYPIPESTGSNSTLFFYEDRLYMVNHGFGYRDNLRNHTYSYAKNNLRAKIGKPFIASFEKESGRNIDFRFLSEKKEMIEDFRIDRENKCAVVLFEVRMMVAPFGSDSVKVHQWNVEECGKIIGILKRPFYLEDKNGSGFKKYNETLGDPTYYIYTDKGKVFDVDLSLNILKSFLFAEIGIYELLENGSAMVHYGNNVLLLNPEGVKKAALRVSSDWFSVGEKIYAFGSDRKRIVEVLGIEDL